MRKFDGLKVKSIRNSKGLSLDELASKVGIETSSLRGIENLDILNIQYETMKKIATAMNVSVSDLFTQDTPIKKNRHSTPVNPKIYKEFIDNVNQYQRLTGATYEKISNIIGKSNSYIYDVIDKQRKSTLSIKSNASLTKGSMILRQEIEKIESGKNRIPSKLTYQTIDRDSEVVFRFNGLIKCVNDLSDKELQIIVSIFDALKIPAKISKIEIRETNVFGGGK
ncbi:helix-turn-helix transcriptional regulator [Streptococcus pneumoniae]|uniref:helix-turn-helix domain-containing protein n=1 Tax=Streptococcus pneumoniae TaxID=1313 RepID=UPI001C5E2B15|nr:helix-turn-helix transcriptional regulator [Streptococcus pneumoniae]MBW5096720.1 helix-turn-helix transcriptional regulator [Streptococcus pneumoniae]